MVRPVRSYSYCSDATALVRDDVRFDAPTLYVHAVPDGSVSDVTFPAASCASDSVHPAIVSVTDSS